MAVTIEAKQHHERRQKRAMVLIGRAQLTPSKPDAKGRYLVTDWFMIVLFPLIPLRRLYVSDLEPTYKPTRRGPEKVEWMQVLGRAELSLPDVLRAVLHRWILGPIAAVLVALPFIWVLQRGSDVSGWLLIISIIGISLVPLLAYLAVAAVTDARLIGDYDVVLRSDT